MSAFVSSKLTLLFEFRHFRLGNQLTWTPLPPSALLSLWQIWKQTPLDPERLSWNKPKKIQQSLKCCGEGDLITFVGFPRELLLHSIFAPAPQIGGARRESALHRFPCKLLGKAWLCASSHPFHGRVPPTSAWLQGAFYIEPRVSKSISWIEGAHRHLPRLNPPPWHACGCETNFWFSGIWL